MESNIKAEILYKPIMELKNFHNIDCQIINWKDSKIVINSKEKLCIQMNQLNYNNPISFISFLEFITENNLKIIESILLKDNNIVIIMEKIKEI